MRIVATVSRWALNGVTVFVEMLCSELRTRGHHASILVTKPHQPPRFPYPAPQDLPLQVLPLASDADDRASTLINWLNRERPDVYLSNGDALDAAMSARLDPAISRIGVLHNDDETFHLRHAPMLGGWDAIVAVGPHIADQVRARRPDLAHRVHVIPHGVAPVSATAKPVGGPLRVIYAGRLEQVQKRVLDVVAAVSLARTRGADIHLTVVGDGTQRPVMEALARAALPASCTFTGPLHAGATRQMLSQCHVSLLTSEHEGFALTVLENMAAGCAPVATRIDAGFRLALRDGDTGLLVPCGDISAIADVLVRLDRDRDWLAAIAQRAKTEAARPEHSLNTMCDRYMDLFESVRVGAHRQVDA